MLQELRKGRHRRRQTCCRIECALLPGSPPPNNTCMPDGDPHDQTSDTTTTSAAVLNGSNHSSPAVSHPSGQGPPHLPLVTSYLYPTGHLPQVILVAVLETWGQGWVQGWVQVAAMLAIRSKRVFEARLRDAYPSTPQQAGHSA